MTPTNTRISEMFPTWFKKTQVTFSGALPVTDDERQQVFVVPYAVFEKAIEQLLADEVSRARKKERNKPHKCYVCKKKLELPSVHPKCFSIAVKNMSLSELERKESKDDPK